MKKTLDEFFDELELLKKAAEAIAEKNLKMRDLLTRMLDPEEFGHAVSNEVRAEIRKVLRSSQTS